VSCFAAQEVTVQQHDINPSREKRAIQLQLRERRGIEALFVSPGDIKGVTSVRMSPMHHAKEWTAIDSPLERANRARSRKARPTDAVYDASRPRVF
jgi:hypothetical protein